jgi:1,4-dihydroxy-2-naphthoate polyprenyltransferase
MNIINSVSRSASCLNREKLVAFVRLGRPKFLLYSLLLFGLGAAIAAHDGSGLDLRGYVVGQLFVWSVHLMTHYCNEYFDLPADLANTSPTRWTGGSRVLVEGTLTPVEGATPKCV